MITISRKLLAAKPVFLFHKFIVVGGKLFPDVGRIEVELLQGIQIFLVTITRIGRIGQPLSHPVFITLRKTEVTLLVYATHNRDGIANQIIKADMDKSVIVQPAAVPPGGAEQTFLVDDSWDLQVEPATGRKAYYVRVVRDNATRPHDAVLNYDTNLKYIN